MERSKIPRGGPEQYILALALLVPLGWVVFAAAQVPCINLSFPPSLVYADSPAQLVTRHPSSVETVPPPILAVPTPTPRRTATSVLVSLARVVPSPTPVL